MGFPHNLTKRFVSFAFKFLKFQFIEEKNLRVFRCKEHWPFTLCMRMQYTLEWQSLYFISPTFQQIFFALRQVSTFFMWLYILYVARIHSTFFMWLEYIVHSLCGSNT